MTNLRSLHLKYFTGRYSVLSRCTFKLASFSCDRFCFKPLHRFLISQPSLTDVGLGNFLREAGTRGMGPLRQMSIYGLLTGPIPWWITRTIATDSDLHYRPPFRIFLIPDTDEVSIVPSLEHLKSSTFFFSLRTKFLLPHSVRFIPFFPSFRSPSDFRSSLRITIYSIAGPIGRSPVRLRLRSTRVVLRSQQLAAAQHTDHTRLKTYLFNLCIVLERNDSFTLFTDTEKLVVCTVIT